MPEIDNTDFYYYLDLLAYKGKGEEHFIDEVF